MSELKEYLSDLRTLLEVLKEMAPPPPPVATLADRLAELKATIEVVRGFDTAPAAPAAAPATTWQQVVERAIAAIERASETRAAPAPGAPSLSPPKVVKVPKWTAPVLQYVPLIVGLADKSPAVDPEQAAAWLIGEYPDQVRELWPILNRDGFPSDLVHAIPELASRAGWVTPFLFALKAKANPDAAAANG